MSNYGFVYALHNASFPEVYKVGCTERSPQRRADELSSGSGVPTPFSVIAFIECDCFQGVERDIHLRLSNFRVNSAREFFKAPISLIARLMFFHPESIGWSDRKCRDLMDEMVWNLDDPYTPMPRPQPLLRSVA